MRYINSQKQDGECGLIAYINACRHLKIKMNLKKAKILFNYKKNRFKVFIPLFKRCIKRNMKIGFAGNLSYEEFAALINMIIDKQHHNLHKLSVIICYCVQGEGHASFYNIKTGQLINSDNHPMKYRFKHTKKSCSYNPYVFIVSNKND